MKCTAQVLRISSAAEFTPSGVRFTPDSERIAVLRRERRVLTPHIFSECFWPAIPILFNFILYSLFAWLRERRKSLKTTIEMKIRKRDEKTRCFRFGSEFEVIFILLYAVRMTYRFIGGA